MLRTIKRLLTCFAILLPFAASGPAAAAAPPTLFKGVNLISMSGKEEVRRNVSVLVAGDRIQGVGKRVRAPRGARIIEGRGLWLVPGLVDAHAHLTNMRSIDVSLAGIAVANGVTSAIELGGMGLPNDQERLRLRGDIIAGDVAGPTYYIGPKVDDSKFSRAEGMALVDRFRGEGYDFIKVYNQLSREGYRGVMLRAGQLGMAVVGHVVRDIGLEGTMGSGQRGIVHMEEYLYTFFPFTTREAGAGAKLDPAAISYLAQITKEAGMWVTPTLITYRRITEQAEDLSRVMALPQARYVPWQLYDGNWIPERNRYSRDFNQPEHHANLRAGLAYQARLTKAFADAGVPLLAGTDAPIPGLVPGFDLHEELAAFVDAGLSPYQALAAATRNAAPYLGKDDFGTIEAGKRADLLLLRANPLSDIRNTAAIEGVMTRGRWYGRVQLDALLEAGRKAGVKPPPKPQPSQP